MTVSPASFESRSANAVGIKASASLRPRVRASVGIGPGAVRASNVCLQRRDIADDAVREFSGREGVLAGRAYEELSIAIPGPAPNVKVSVFTPPDRDQIAPGIFWIHGGGLVSGDRFNCAEALDVGAAVSAVVASVEYRLAPEHPAPAASDDVLAALTWIAGNAEDLFRDEDVAFASTIWACGGDAELHVWPGASMGSN